MNLVQIYLKNCNKTVIGTNFLALVCSLLLKSFPPGSSALPLTVLIVYWYNIQLGLLVEKVKNCEPLLGITLKKSLFLRTQTIPRALVVSSKYVQLLIREKKIKL